jgi:hypothetical protein
MGYFVDVTYFIERQAALFEICKARIGKSPRLILLDTKYMLCSSLLYSLI